MFHHYTLTCINILICTVQGSYLASLLLHKIFFKLGLVWNATQNPNFVFLLWFLVQFLVFKERQLFVSVVIIIIIVGIMRFLSRVINYLLQCFSVMSIFAKYVSQIFYFLPQIFFRTDFGSSCKKSFEYAGKFLSPIAIFYFDVKKI